MGEIDPEVLFRRQIKRQRIGLAIGLSIVASVAMYPCCSVMWSVSGEMAESRAYDAQFDHEATPEQRASVERALATAEAGLPARSASFEAATQDLASLVPREDLGSCPIHIPLRSPSSAERGGSIDLNYDAFETLAFPGQQGFPWALVGSEAPRVAYARERIRALREGIQRHDRLDALAGVVTGAEALSGAFWTWDVVVVPGEWRMPHAELDGVTFDGGYVSGTAFVHDYASGTVICAGTFEATTTSELVDYRADVLDMGQTLTRMLVAEMNAEIERAISRSVVWRAGPALAPLDEEVPL